MIIPYRLNETVLYFTNAIIPKRYKNASALGYERIRGIFLVVRVRADFTFNIVNQFRFLIMLKKSVHPFGSFTGFFPITRNRFFIKPSNISKFFYSQITFFKFIFKFLIVHINAFEKVIIYELYQNKSK
jgi:hypothetical protein